MHGDQRWFQMPAYLHNGNWADIVCVSKFISISTATTTLHFDNWITDIAKKHYTYVPQQTTVLSRRACLLP